MVGHYDQLLKQLEANLVRQATLHDPRACRLLRTIPGIGKILSLVLLYEIHTIDRFPSVGDFLSYARLVTPKQTSDGKVTGHGGAKIGNVHLKWAFSEAVLWMLRYSDDAKAFLKRKEKKYGKARAMTMLARKIARAVYQMLKRKEPFDAVKFFRQLTRGRRRSRYDELRSREHSTHLEPALSDWTAAGARTYLIPMRDDDGFDKA